MIGLSRPRGTGTFDGLALEEALSRRGAEARCGLLVVDLRTGDAVHWLRLGGSSRNSTTWLCCPTPAGRWHWG